MLAVVPLRDKTKDDNLHGCVSESSFSFNPEEFPDFSDGSLLESIDFDDLFAGINDGTDVLPDLEMDPEILAEFSASTGGEESETNASGKSTDEDSNHHHSCQKEEQVSGSGSESGKGDEIVNSKRENEKGRKSSSAQASKNSNQRKRKVKVDWTPELHRRFVQAVEQLGVDKAVPSRILELMGIDCLTRHNIASHLQKYRSHRKHLLAREAEAASWTQRRQMYAGCGAGGKKSESMSPWMGPTMGFPPPMHHPHLIRPLHVWGHPSVDQARIHFWPKHLPHSPPPPPAWIPPPPPPHPASFWPHHHHHRPVPNVPSPGTPCFPQAIPASRFGAGAAAAAVGGVPPPPSHVVVPTGQMGPPQLPPTFDPQPQWKENIDESIGDVLSKPWLPLPLGLKPPSIDSVMGELQRQGVPKVPPNPTPPPCGA